MLISRTAEKNTTRLSKIANASQDDADIIEVNMTKTFTHHVFAREEIKVTDVEVAEVESGYEHKCDFCVRRFKTQRGMYIYRAQCAYNYDTTDEIFDLEEATAVFGHKDARWFRLKRAGYDKEEWEREHLLTRDGCTDSIRNFWSRSGLNPTQEFYEDPEGLYRCAVCGKTCKRVQDLKAHKTRMRHHEMKTPKRTVTSIKDAIQEKRKTIQDDLDKVVWTRHTATGVLELKDDNV